MNARMHGVSAFLLGGCLSVAVGGTPATHADSAAVATSDELVQILKPEPNAQACFVRTYSADHMKKHPQQTVADIRFSLAYVPKPAGSDLSTGSHSYLFGLTAEQREQDRPFATIGECRQSNRGIECSVECDGGGIAVVPRGDNKVQLEFGRFERIGTPEACSEGPEAEAAAMELRPGVDDRVFLLVKRPLAECQQ